MPEFPENIQHIILKSEPCLSLVLKTDMVGNILEWEGHFEAFFHSSFSPQKKLKEHELFNSYCPFPGENLHLPNMQLKEGFWVDIYLQKNDGFIFILFIDKTDEVNAMQNKIQSRNEFLFIEKEKVEDMSETDVFRDLVSDLNVAVFQLCANKNYKLIGCPPSWLNDFIEPNTCSNEMAITDYFPFLEIFIPSLDGLKNAGAKKIYSDLWTEVGKSGKESYLQSIGLMKNNLVYLLIISHEGVLFKDRELLQKGRENELFTEQLTKAKNELERLLKFKDQFVSIVSHDLRSPISSVISITNMMLADDDFTGKIGDSYLDFVEIVNKDMKLLLEYNEKLYHWSNLQLGKFNLEYRCLNLSEIVHVAKNRFLQIAKEKSISVKIEIDESIVIEADESLFTQVLTNLLGNALKFTPPNGNITINSDLEKSKIVLSISDNGLGIKPGIAKDLFSGYVKEHKSGTNGEKGTGLGLGIVKRILDAHGFEIKVDSVVNKGTAFTIQIPPNKCHKAD
jgi:signal transduction histidine kinase